MASCKPKPTSNKAVQPAMPITVINKRFLYKKRFLSVTFHENEMRRHKGRIRSRRIRFPALGARGSISGAGCSRKLESTEQMVAISVMPIPNPAEKTATSAFMGSGGGNSGIAYITEYAFIIISGKTWHKTPTPKTEPIPAASNAYIKYFVAICIVE